jgi:HPt (histidine-containing phosphotransfer) domain-containing protein
MMSATHLDTELLMKRFGGRGIARDVCRLYLEESPAVVADYRRVDPGDLKSMGAAAHRLKGSLGMLGADALTALAHELEQACREGNDEVALRLYKELDAGLGGLRREVELLSESL